MKIAKSRKWDQAEVEEAVAALKKRPGLWEELVRIEATTGEFGFDGAGLEEMRIISRLHPDCELNERTGLLLAIRLYRRAALGPR